MLTDAVIQTSSARFTYHTTGAGPPVILVPGSGGWRLTFDRMTRELSATNTVYAIDPPGQGGTIVTDPTFNFTTDAVATSLDQLMAAIGLESAAIVGHSWGGGFALRLAQLYPRRVQRLALLAPAGLVVRDVWEFRLLRLPLIGEIATRFTTPRSLRHMLRKSFTHHTQLPAQELIHHTAQQLRNGPDAAVHRHNMLAIERNITWHTTQQHLAKIQCPTLILWGNKDRYLPPHLLNTFRAHIPHAHTHIIPEAGHSVHDDVPHTTYQHLLPFLTTKTQK